MPPVTRSLAHCTQFIFPTWIIDVNYRRFHANGGWLDSYIPHDLVHCDSRHLHFCRIYVIHLFMYRQIHVIRATYLLPQILLANFYPNFWTGGGFLIPWHICISILNYYWHRVGRGQAVIINNTHLSSSGQTSSKWLKLGITTQ